MLIPAWPSYRKVDLQKRIKEAYSSNASMTELFDEILGPHFLTLPDGENILLKYLPEFLHFLEMVVITSTESVEVLLLRHRVNQLLEDAFVLTSDVESVKRREEALGIRADPSTESLDFRRQRILNRYRMHPPFTRRWLQRQLDSLVGPGMTVVSVDYENHILYVTANIDDANVFSEVVHTIETVKPASMIYQQRTSAGDVIGIEESISKQDITWNYKLDGSWRLGEKPFASFGPEEVVK